MDKNINTNNNTLYVYVLSIYLFMIIDIKLLLNHYTLILITLQRLLTLRIHLKYGKYYGF